MSKEKNRGNRETKKPKREKPKAPASLKHVPFAGKKTER